jgi:hypothetical protein
MIIVKADKASEAGALPTKEMLTEMGKFNEELVKAGVMLAAEGAPRELERRARQVLGREGNRDRWTIRGDERTDRRFLAVASEV